MQPSGRDPRGSLVRPYAVTRGRTEPRRDIALEAVMLTTVRGLHEVQFTGRDKQLIARLCDGKPHSLAEIAAHLGQPLGVARVLAADMVADGQLALHESMLDDSSDDRLDVLERVLSGLRRL